MSILAVAGVGPDGTNPAGGPAGPISAVPLTGPDLRSLGPAPGIDYPAGRTVAAKSAGIASV